MPWYPLCFLCEKVQFLATTVSCYFCYWLNTAGQIRVIILSYTAVVVEDLSHAPLSSILWPSALNPSYMLNTHGNITKRGKAGPLNRGPCGAVVPGQLVGWLWAPLAPSVQWEVLRAGSAREGNLKSFDMSPLFRFHLNPPVHTYFIFSSDSVGGTEFCQWGHTG